MTDPIISVADAIRRHGNAGTVFLDATWTFEDGPQPRVTGRIPGARPIDIDTVKDEASSLPHMLPPPDVFERHARALGINRDSELIVYDRMGLFSAARVWWMFRAMGHEAVRVLDGGLPLWLTAGGPVENGPADDWPQGDFTADLQPHRLAGREHVLDAVTSGTHQILDARPAARFAGSAAEPRPGMRSGHMPGALSLPFIQLLNERGELAGQADHFRAAGLHDDRPVITTCGSGVTACILALGLERLGRTAAVYDGSWAEWGSRDDTPIETGQD